MIVSFIHYVLEGHNISKLKKGWALRPHIGMDGI